MKVTKLNQRDDNLLLENIYKSLINKEYEQVLNLVSTNNINPSIKLDNWIKSVNERHLIDMSINKLIKWIIYKG